MVACGRSTDQTEGGGCREGRYGGIQSKEVSREECVSSYSYALGIANPECESQMLKNLLSGNLETPLTS